MAKKENIIGLRAKSGSIIMLVNQYTEMLKNYLETGKKKPLPQFFMDRYAKKTGKDELRAQLNISTLLSLYGREQRLKTQKALKNNKVSFKAEISKWMEGC